MSADPISRSSSPTAPPSVALSSSVPALDRSISTASTITTLSNGSVNGSGPDVIAAKRRGYMRPQATVFADSARNRDSVMSLGSIAHLQYYFARTGLLDGKGAQLAREKERDEDGSQKRTASATYVRRPMLVQRPAPKARAVSETLASTAPRPTPLAKAAMPQAALLPAPRPTPRPAVRPAPKPAPVAAVPKPPVVQTPTPNKPAQVKPAVQPPAAVEQPAPAKPEHIVSQPVRPKIEPVIDLDDYDPFNYTQYQPVSSQTTTPTKRKETKAWPQADPEPEPEPEPEAVQSFTEEIPEVILTEEPIPQSIVEQPLAPEPQIEVDAQPEFTALAEVEAETADEVEAVAVAETEAQVDLEPEFMQQAEFASEHLSIPEYERIPEIPSPTLSADESVIEYVWDDETNPALTLPPTVSTYKQKSTYIPPPPNQAVLRRELREALEDAQQLFKDVISDSISRKSADDKENEAPSDSPGSPSASGWHQVQGLQVLDLSTLAIRAAKNYYTSHEKPSRLYSLKSEREIRSGLYAVLEVLKKMAARNFAGGVRTNEIKQIEEWMHSISDLVDRDEAKENEEHEKRQTWTWLDGDWSGRERERELNFLKSFDHESDVLPEWQKHDGTSEAGPFLHAMETGLRLVRLHNALVKNSARQFEEIKVFHTDTAKPYRCAENLRFWIKAAELRWDVHLEVDVSSIVNGTNKPEAWSLFDEAILKWSSAVREQIVKEWKEHRETLSMEKPILRMDPSLDQQEASPVPW